MYDCAIKSVQQGFKFNNYYNPMRDGRHKFSFIPEGL